MSSDPKIKSVCVFCASSRNVDSHYHKTAFQLGKQLAENSLTVIYGGGAVGSMGHLADGALSAGGTVLGVIPKFMMDLEWGHKKINELIIVNTMNERKEKMLEYSDAVISLPGGSGTFEELFAAISLKRLGLYLKPIIVVNTNGYYDHFVKLMDQCINERFMNERHRNIWRVVTQPETIINALFNAPKWSPKNRDFVVL